MLTKEENEILTRVGHGTPGGELLRRYWWPVGFSEEVKEKDRPRRVQLLCEDLVLFRDGNGQLGVLQISCSHRGASLEFGRVEDRGIRCCYHGWLYAPDGRCLQQPAEPETSTYWDRVRQPPPGRRSWEGSSLLILGQNLHPYCRDMTFSCWRTVAVRWAAVWNTAIGCNRPRTPLISRISLPFTPAPIRI